MGKAKIGIAAWVILAVAALGAVPNLAYAQDEEGAEASVESEAPGENLDRKIRSLRWGTAVSTVVIPLGMGLWLGGAAACSVDGIFSNQGCSAGEKAAVGIGIGLMVAGTAGMIASAVLLRRRKQDRKSLHAARRLHWSHASGSFVF